MLFVSCKFNPNIQGNGETYLQGEWIQDSVAHQDQLLRYTLYQFKFTCDSVYITLQTKNKARTEIDSCYGDGNWKEYARGVYLVRNDSLLIEATFTHANWKQKISGCHRIGLFLPRFKIADHQDSVVSLLNDFHETAIELRKTKTISCVPKPI